LELFAVALMLMITTVYELFKCSLTVWFIDKNSIYTYCSRHEYGSWSRSV